MLSSGNWGRNLSVLALAGFVFALRSAPVLAQASASDAESVMPMAQAVGKSNGHRLQVTVLKAGDSSRRQRSAAIDQLPMQHLNPAAQREVQRIVKNISLYRRLPTVELFSDRRVYEYFTTHPDVAVSIWRALDISQVQMFQTGPFDYETDTRDGTLGTVTVLHQSPTSYVILCKGQFQSPALTKPIRAEAVMHLQPHFNDNGTVWHELDLFVSFSSQTVETMAKLVSPLSNRIADKNFEEVSLFVEMMSTAMSRQPGWVEQLAGRLDGVLPERPNQLLSVTAQVYVDAERRRLAAAGQQPTLQAVVPPAPERVPR
ncbi:hypothetical protein [Planctomicrobium sp. SH664]|uniref:hypothetical protein n=1 Tax=Planctomicrobium sp. SH664 TaxID=3448125 RepID=UPI003F5B8634